MTFVFPQFFVRMLRLGLLLITVNATAAVQFRALSWQGGISDLLFKSGGREITLIANDSGLSVPYDFSGPGPLELYRLVTIDDKTTRQTVATIPVPSGLNRALLILVMSPDGACSGKWLDNTVDTTPTGMLRIHNLSSSEIAVNAGRDIRALAVGASAGIVFAENARTLPIRVALRTKDRWDVALNFAQPVRSRLRFIAIVRDGRPTPDEPDRALDWVCFHELPPPPIEPSEGP